MRKANVKILKTVAVVFGVASSFALCVFFTSVLGSSVIQSDEVSGAAAESLMAESIAESLMAEFCFFWFKKKRKCGNERLVCDTG